jgi:hypothetical protein
VKYFELRSWSKYQHYKDRNPPWVKLYTAWPDDYEWSCWSDASKLLAVCIVMLAGRVANRIPLDPTWIQQRCGLKKTPDLSELFAVGFIQEIQSLPPPEQSASSSLAECKQGASDPLALARSRETETETETDRDRGGGASAPSVGGLDVSSWDRWSAYRVEIRKPLKPASIPAAQKALAAFGSDQAAVVEQSIAQGWQGLFPLKEKTKPNGRSEWT